MPKIKPYTQLLNGCYRTEISVSPANWETKAAKTSKNGKSVEWMIWYRFHDPAFQNEHPSGYLVKIRGMNKFKILEQRQDFTRQLLATERNLLDVQHYNPITESYMAAAPDASPSLYIPPDDRSKSTQEYLELIKELVPGPSTPFIPALWMGLIRVQGESGTINDMGSIIRGTEDAAKLLITELGTTTMRMDELQIQHVRKKHIRLILEKCAQIRSRWSNNRHNRYRAYLQMMFKPLVTLEAIDNNPIHGIDVLAKTENIRVLPTAAQRREINDFILSKDYYFWRLVQIFFHSGGRETELMRVRESDVDLPIQRFKVLVKKGKKRRWVWKVIKDIAVPLWEEVLRDCQALRVEKKTDADIYLFAKFLQPGLKPIRTDQFARRWTKWVKSPKTGLGIDVDLYTLKHLNTTEVMDVLTGQDSDIEAAEKDVAGLNSHTTSNMVVGVYDVKNQERKLNRVKGVKNTFS